MEASERLGSCKIKGQNPENVWEKRGAPLPVEPRKQARKGASSPTEKASRTLSAWSEVTQRMMIGKLDLPTGRGERVISSELIDRK